jgi:hypothetical protein
MAMGDCAMDRICIAGTAAALMLAIVWSAGADPKQAEKPSKLVPSEPAAADRRDKDTESKRDSKMPIFIPRDEGAPQARVRGASRGPGFEKVPSVDALVPEQVGYTLDAQPTLYWYLSDSTERRVDFTLHAADSKSVDPEFETALRGPLAAGINRIDLASYGVTLKPGVIYMWYISLFPHSDSESDARVSGGAIQLMTTPPELQVQLDAADTEQRPFVLAAAGIWYDALGVLSESVRSGSDRTRPRAQRAALLEQVGLGNVVVP